jgi:hypothetical protein
MMRAFGKMARWALPPFLLAGALAVCWVSYGNHHVPRRWSMEYLLFGGIAGDNIQVYLDSEGHVVTSCPRTDSRPRADVQFHASATDLQHAAMLLDEASRTGAIQSPQWWSWLKRDRHCEADRIEHLPSCECWVWSLDITYGGLTRPLLDIDHPSAPVVELTRLSKRLHDAACGLAVSGRTK